MILIVIIILLIISDVLPLIYTVCHTATPPHNLNFIPPFILLCKNREDIDTPGISLMYGYYWAEGLSLYIDVDTTEILLHSKCCNTMDCFHKYCNTQIHKYCNTMDCFHKCSHHLFHILASRESRDLSLRILSVRGCPNMPL